MGFAFFHGLTLKDARIRNQKYSPIFALNPSTGKGAGLFGVVPASVVVDRAGAN